MEKPLELFERYAKEIESDTSVDITNVLEKQLSSPNVKHKWLYRLAQSKIRLLKLIGDKEAFISSAMQKDNPLKLSKAAIASKVELNTSFKELQTEIKEQELLVEYLDANVNKIFSQMGFDFRNLVELMKMEQL